MTELTKEQIQALKESADAGLRFWREMYSPAFMRLCDLAIEALEGRERAIDHLGPWDHLKENASWSEQKCEQCGKTTMLVQNAPPQSSTATLSAAPSNQDAGQGEIAEGAPKHDLYKNGDKNIPDSVLDRNGQVCLDLCRRCGKGEAELIFPCVTNNVLAPGERKPGEIAGLRNDARARQVSEEQVSNPVEDTINVAAQEDNAGTRLQPESVSEPASAAPLSDTPRTDALRKLVGEIYESDIAAVEHVLEKYLELERELQEIKAQLPEEMKHCTILFKQCARGHGELTATNWVQNECRICRAEAAERENAELRRDAERMEWLERRKVTIDFTYDESEERGLWVIGVWVIPGGANNKEWELAGSGETVRAAIDNAKG